MPLLPPSLQHSVDQYIELLGERADEAGVRLPDLQQLPGDITRIFACSEFVAGQCAHRPALLADLAATDLHRSYAEGVDDAGYSRVVDQFRSSISTAAGDESQQDLFMRILRDLRRREMVRIAWRDIGGLADLDETVRDTSALADAVIQTSLTFAARTLYAGLGEPVSATGEPQDMVVLALGKLGATELNFSSDIDLIFAFAESGSTQGGKRSLSHEEYFAHLARKLIKLINEPTADGQVFRVDVRLRPFGNSGPLVMSFRAMEDYYQNHGRDWERYALIRARPVTNEQAGDALLASLRPFIYRRYLDFGALESLRDMKKLITREVARKGLEANIKLGAGGIREIEFCGQAFQMVRGGRQLELRDRNILRVLKILRENDYLPDYAERELSNAYRFLRNTEHRLQQVNDRQTHTLPGDEEGRQRLVLGMGFSDWDSFSTVLTKHRAKVNAHFLQVFGVGTDAAASQDDELDILWLVDLNDTIAHRLLTETGYADAAGAWERLQSLFRAYSVRLLDGKARERLQRLLPDLIRAASKQDNATQTLQRILDVVETIARRSAYLSLLSERPIALSQLVALCAASPWIAKHVRQHPLLLDELLDPRALYRPLDGAALNNDLTRRMANVSDGDTEQEMATLRQFKQASTLRVAAADIAQRMPLMVVSDHLTQIAETAVAQTLALACRDLERRYGEPQFVHQGKRQSAAFAIIGYGKLGGLELGYGSDLDVIFLYDGHGTDATTSGPKVVDNSVFFSRLAQRLIRFLSTMTADGTMYDVDARLRPGGASGLLVNNIQAFGGYQVESAWTWEHQALVRARAIAGNPALMRQFEALRLAILKRARPEQRLRREVRDMRERMRAELGSKTSARFDLKQDPGGIADIEFVVQYATLRWASRLGEHLRFSDNIRLLEGFGATGLMAQEDVAFLSDAYRAYRARLHALALQEAAGDVAQSEFRDYRQGVMRIWKAMMESNGEDSTR